MALQNLNHVLYLLQAPTLAKVRYPSLEVRPTCNKDFRQTGAMRKNHHTNKVYKDGVLTKLCLLKIFLLVPGA
jgi:hypothetical protein